MLKKDGSMEGSNHKDTNKDSKRMDTSDEREVKEAIMEEPSMMQHSSQSRSPQESQAARSLRLGVTPTRDASLPTKKHTVRPTEVSEVHKSTNKKNNSNKFMSVGHWPSAVAGSAKLVSPVRDATDPSGLLPNKRVTFKVGRTPEGTLFEESSGLVGRVSSQQELLIENQGQPKTKFQRVLAGYKPISTTKPGSRAALERTKATKNTTGDGSLEISNARLNNAGKRALDIGSKEVSTFKIADKPDHVYKRRNGYF